MKQTAVLLPGLVTPETVRLTLAVMDGGRR
jgi:hypothetical protein